MQVHYVARLLTTAQGNLMRRTLSRVTLPALRNVIQSGSGRTFRPSYQSRYASSTSSNDEQAQNEEKKKNMTNLIYVAGALTGLGAIYSLVCYSPLKNQ